MGFPELTAQFSVWKTTGKDSSEACIIASQNCAVYSVFPSGMTWHSKIAQFNWECIARFT
jgi:3-oxoacyl-(acyl-carrier-protein) synthase